MNLDPKIFQQSNLIEFSIYFIVHLLSKPVKGANAPTGKNMANIGHLRCVHLP